MRDIQMDEPRPDWISIWVVLISVFAFSLLETMLTPVLPQIKTYGACVGAKADAGGRIGLQQQRHRDIRADDRKAGSKHNAAGKTNSGYFEQVQVDQRRALSQFELYPKRSKGEPASK